MWRWILLALLALLALLCLTRVGVEAAFSGGGGLRLDIRLGPLRLGILPGKKKAEKKSKKPENARKKKPQKAQKDSRAEPGKLPPIALEDMKDALRTLLPALKRALQRIGRGIRLHPFQLSLVLGGRADAAKAAQNYGRIQTAVWSGMPLAEQLLDIPAPSIHTSVDFDATSTAAEGEIGVTFRVGTLLALGFGLLVPALGWLLRFWKRSKTAKQTKPARQEEKAA